MYWNMNWIKREYRTHPVRLTAGLILPAGMFSPVTARVVLRYKNNEPVTWQEAMEMYRWLDSGKGSAAIPPLPVTPVCSSYFSINVRPGPNPPTCDTGIHAQQVIYKI
jgi:hypothetical protein